MTEQTKTPRIKPEDFCMGDASPFQQEYKARTVHPLDHVAVGEAFLDLRGMLWPGDEISICQYDKADYRSARLVASCKVQVVEKDAHTVEVTAPYDVREVPPRGTAEPETPAEPEVLFSDGSWRAVHQHFGRYQVETGTGQVLLRDLTKDAATLLAAGQYVGVIKTGPGEYAVHDPEGRLRDKAA